MKLKRLLKRVGDVLPGHVERWIRRGRPAPPPYSVKVRNLLVLADLFDISVLVETGTYKGDMIAATLDRFDHIYSIEIDPRWARAAQARFRRASGKVHILLGDSGKVLPEIIEKLPDRALFFLDGHYSGPQTGRGDSDTPVLAEIDVIARYRVGRGDVIIIDDARLFGRLPSYPNLQKFQALLRERLGGTVLVADDAIVVLPTSAPTALPR